MIHATLTLKRDDQQVLNINMRLTSTKAYEFLTVVLWQKLMSIALTFGFMPPQSAGQTYDLERTVESAGFEFPGSTEEPEETG